MQKMLLLLVLIVHGYIILVVMGATFVYSYSKSFYFEIHNKFCHVY